MSSARLREVPKVDDVEENLEDSLLETGKGRKNVSLIFKAAASGTYILSVMLIALMYYALKKYVSPDDPINWASFALHPLLMTLAFGLLGPVGAATWRCFEHGLGLSHSLAKFIHFSLLTAAAVIGVVGVADMWVVHENGASVQVSKGWAVHFQSAHSWLGISSLIVFVAQAAGGVFTFYNPAVEVAKKQAFMPVHVFLGSFALFGTLMSIITGILTLGYRGDNQSPKDVLFKACAMIALGLCGCLALIYAAPKPRA
eukprot:CAMPEP_0172594064 /NCGR_PEP_ID=MMETSP1068-20121228/13350_1 /TAXON_ID=35684 /ORGANISM="Pseudopedinella elastica, Strain CCMP716" /LENGTH=256 /DNA_ID=CAMNT_0013391861 /DNA_START=125 /DNA_END=895 /DNA_ORIENTATION=-